MTRRIFTFSEIRSATALPRLGILPKKYEGEGGIRDIATLAIQHGYDEVTFTPHFSSPDDACAVDASDRDTLDLWRSYVGQVRRVQSTLNSVGTPIRLIAGVEANIIGPAGELDLPEAWRDLFDVVIASPHRNMPRDPDAIASMLAGAASQPMVDILGRPTRYTETVSGIDWRRVMYASVVSGVALELSFNSYHSYGPNKLIRRGASADAIRDSRLFWSDWLSVIGSFGGSALTFFGLGAHNAGQWPTPISRGAPEHAWMPTVSQCDEFLALAGERGATDRLVNGGRTGFYPRRRNRTSAEEVCRRLEVTE